MQSKENYVLITGGTSGIGYELAKIFAENKYNLVIVARVQEELEKTSEELKQQYGVAVETIQTDLFNTENAFKIYDEVVARGISVDILVNNAGQGLYGEFIHTELTRELAIIELNISSLVVLTKQFLQAMVLRGSGKILNLSSVAGKAPGPLQSVYHATKAFVQSFTEAIRIEVLNTGVTVTALLPGATDTDFFNKAGMLEAKNVQEGKLADPAGVAQDGYEALIDGDDMVVSGLRNKLQVALSNILPDRVVAENVHKQQAPANK